MENMIKVFWFNGQMKLNHWLLCMYSIFQYNKTFC